MVRINSAPEIGDVGQDILAMQDALRAKGRRSESNTGIFDASTKAEISAFQKENGLEGTGTPGPVTLQLLGLEPIVPSPVTGNDPHTKDLKGKMDRHLHPNKRVQIEAAVFPNELIPDCFSIRDPAACYAYVMEKIAGLGFHESGGNNMGADVGEIQGTTDSFTKGGNGDAWCDDYAQMGIAIIEDFFQVESSIIGSAHCMTTFRAAVPIPGLVSKTPEAGTLALGKHGSTDNGHAMACLKVNSDGTMVTSEGNTSFENMRDGDGSGIRTRNQFTNGDLKTQGWVRLYPNNKIPTKAA